MPSEARAHPANDDEEALLGPVLELLLLALVTAVSAALRSRRLAEWPLDADEVQLLKQVDLLVRPGQEALAAGAALTGDALHHVVHWLLGFTATPQAALRLAPLSAGVLGLPLLHALVRGHTGPLTAMAFTLLVAFHPWHFQLSTLGQPHAVVFVLGGAALVLISRGAAEGRAGGQVVGALLLLVALTFHRSALLVAVPLIGLAFLPVAAARRPSRAAALVLLAGILLLAADVGRRGGLAARGAWSTAPGPLPLAGEVVLHVGLALPLLAAAAFLSRRQPQGGRTVETVVLLGGGALLVALAAFLPLEVHHLAAALPALFLLAARGLAELLRATAGQRLAQLALVSMALLPSVPVFLSGLIDNSRYDVPTVASYLEREHRPGEPVLAQAPALTAFYSGLDCEELPKASAELVERLTATEGRVFVLMLLQRGRIVAPIEPALQRHVESHLVLLARSARKRMDMRRFETRLYLWNPALP